MQQGDAKESEDEYNKVLKQNQIYLAIISRYKEYIEEKENLSIAELPRLVTPKDEAVAEKVKELQANFKPYVYENEFYNASILTQHFVNSNISNMVLPLQFWLSPAETLRFMIGDEVDKNILLCSLLVALGNPSAKVLINVRDGAMNVYVYYEFKEKFYLMSKENDVQVFESKDSMLKSMEISEDSVVYEFNDRTYTDIC